MTNKATNIQNKFIAKLETEAKLYELGISTSDEARKNARQINKEYIDMITYMFRYGLLSEIDYLAMCSNVTDIYCDIIERIA